MAIIAWPAKVGGLDNVQRDTEIVFVGGFDVLAIQEVEPPTFIIGESRHEERLRLEREEAQRLAQLRARVSGVPTGEIPDLIRDRAIAYGIDELKAVAIASCESFNPTQWNYLHKTNPQKYTAYGIGQITKGTWEATRKRMGRSIERTDDPNEQVETFVYLLATGGEGHWKPYSGHCYLPKYEAWR